MLPTLEYIAENIKSNGTYSLHVSANMQSYSALVLDEKGQPSVYQHVASYPFELPSEARSLNYQHKKLRLHTPFTLIPTSEYDNSMKKKIAREAFKFNPIDFIGEFQVDAYTGLYLIDRELRSLLIREFQDFNVEHVLETLLPRQLDEKQGVLAHWFAQGLILIAVNDGLKLANYYEIHAAEDAIYYTLTGYKHADLDPLSQPLSMNGHVTSDSVIFNKLQGFVRHFNWTNQALASSTISQSFESHLFHHLM